MYTHTSAFPRAGTASQTVKGSSMLDLITWRILLKHLPYNLYLLDFFCLWTLFQRKMQHLLLLEGDEYLQERCSDHYPMSCEWSSDLKLWSSSLWLSPKVSQIFFSDCSEWDGNFCSRNTLTDWHKILSWFFVILFLLRQWTKTQDTLFTSSFSSVFLLTFLVCSPLLFSNYAIISNSPAKDSAT